MKSTSQNQESSKKKQAGEYLKIADKLLKQGEFDAALVEVERCLEIDQGNFYAHAYKERIISLRAKHKDQPAPQAAPAAPAAVPAPDPPVSAHSAPAAAAPPPPHREEKAVERPAAAKPGEQQGAPLTQEEARKKFLEEKRRNEEELRKQAEEARRRAEEELRRRAQELEAMHTTESLERRKAQEEEKRKREDERRRPSGEDRARVDSDARRRAEELARKKLEEDLQARNAGAQRSAEEAEALRTAEAEGKARAKEQKIYDYLLEAKDLVAKRSFAEAVIPLLKITTIEKGHAEAAQMLTGLRQIVEQSWEPKIREAENVSRDLALGLYRKALAVAHREGAPDPATATIIADLRKQLNITDAEHASVEPHAKLDAYTSALREQSAAGGSNDALLGRLRKELGITDEQHAAIAQKR